MTLTQASWPVITEQCVFRTLGARRINSSFRLPLPTPTLRHLTLMATPRRTGFQRLPRLSWGVPHTPCRRCVVVGGEVVGAARVPIQLGLSRLSDEVDGGSVRPEILRDRGAFRGAHPSRGTSGDSDDRRLAPGGRVEGTDDPAGDQAACRAVGAWGGDILRALVAGSRRQRG